MVRRLQFAAAMAQLHEAEEHPADLDGDTLVRPTYGIEPRSEWPSPSSAPTRPVTWLELVGSFTDTLAAPPAVITPGRGTVTTLQPVRVELAAPLALRAAPTDVVIREKVDVGHHPATTVLFAFAALALSTCFDVMFAKIATGNFVSELWYFTTALSFAAFGYVAALWTRATKLLVVVAALVAAAGYGVLDFAVRCALDVPPGTSLILAARATLIALGFSIAWALRGFATRDQVR